MIVSPFQFFHYSLLKFYTKINADILSTGHSGYAEKNSYKWHVMSANFSLTPCSWLSIIALFHF